MIEFVIIIFFFIVCIAIFKGVQDSCSGSRSSRAAPRTYTRSSRRTSSKKPQPFGVSDPSSSPVGGTCLSCGTKVTDETSLYCPECGVKRTRCPICQRFVVGGQALLACPHCRTLGHANEMISWVKQKRKCPHCGRSIKERNLFSP